MKSLLNLLSLAFAAQCLAAPYAPPSVPVTDPAHSLRFHCSVEKFNFTKNRFETEKGAGLVSDGNESTGAQFEGRQQFVLELSKPEFVQSISLVGNGSARFTVSVSTDKPAPGAAWQQVLKNVPLSTQWGTDRQIDRLARFVLIETDTATRFNLNELAVYGKLAPVGASGRRYLADVWNNAPAEEPLAAIGAGPKSATHSGKPGAASTGSTGRSVLKSSRTGGSGAKRGR